MKCLVLGGAGFIGSHLCDVLVRAGFEVSVFDRAEANKDNLSCVENKIDYIAGDFSQRNSFEDVLQGIDYVFHLVSTTVPKTSNEDMIGDVQTNLVPSLALLDGCVQKSVKKVIFFSSGGTVYGIPKVVPITEEHNLNPLCSYGIQKLAIEKYLHLYHHLYGLDYAVMRVANPYGPRQNPFGMQGVIATFMARSFLRLPVEVWGDGSVVRDFLHISDVVGAALLLMKYSGKEKIFNIGSGKGHSVIEIINEIKKACNIPVMVSLLASEKRDVAVNVLDISRAKNELGWSPQVSLNEGIREMGNCWSPEKRLFVKVNNQTIGCSSTPRAVGN